MGMIGGIIVAIVGLVLVPILFATVANVVLPPCQPFLWIFPDLACMAQRGATILAIQIVGMLAGIVAGFIIGQKLLPI